ncbi:MAG: DNA cytosine methyltransferase [Chloroflexi bacterium]|nr:DNA cytosine methyltransferase [Chloroflexota bacterium]
MMSPKVFLTIDTEEDLWGEFRIQDNPTTNVSRLPNLQAFFNEFGAIPTYLVNWPVVTDDTACAVLDRLNGTVHDHLNYSPGRRDIMKLVPPGKNWRWFRDNPDYGIEFTKKIMGGAWSSGGGKVGFFRRLDPDKPSPTLPTSPIQKSTALCHPWEDRPLSVQEYAAIQTFPPNFEFAGSIYSRYKQIGNAVPVRLGQVIGNAVNNVIKSSVSGTVQARLFEAKETYDVART